MLRAPRSGALLGRRLAALRHTRAGGRRNVRLRLAQRRPVARVGLAALLVLPRDRVLELAHAAAERSPERGQPLGAEDDQQHDDDENDLEGAYLREHVKPPMGSAQRSAPPPPAPGLPAPDLRTHRSSRGTRRPILWPETPWAIPPTPAHRRPRRPRRGCTSARTARRGSSRRWPGSRPDRASGRSRCSARTANGGTPTSSTRRRSSASTKSSTAAPKPWCATCCG